jgi:hypothetical protein
MQLQVFSLILAVLPLLANAAPVAKGKGQVKMAFDIGGRTEVTSDTITKSTCMSVASGAVLVAMKTSPNIACRMRSNGCNSNAATSPPMSGNVNLNGSGELASFAQVARSIECGPKDEDPDAAVVEISYSIDGEAQEAVKMDVTSAGCMTLPDGIAFDGVTMGSKAACDLVTNCAEAQQVQSLSGGASPKKLNNALAKGAKGLKCSAA